MTMMLSPCLIQSIAFAGVRSQTRNSAGHFFILSKMTWSRQATGFEHVPAVGQLGDDADSKAMLRLIASTAEIGRSLATAPQVLTKRVKLLRQAFQKMVADPAFQATAQQRNAPLAAASG